VKLAIPPRLVRTFATPLVSALAGTWRYRIHDDHHWQELAARGEAHAFMLWHEAILPLLWVHRNQGIAIVVSQAREGRYLSDYAARLGYALLPGSSSKGGTRALLGAVRALQGGGTIAITPDGPRGPRRVIKPGLIRAAQRAAAWIVPLHASVGAAWRLNSWDRLMIPKPLAQVTVVYGTPFRIDAGPAGLESGVTRSIQAMANLEQRLESQ
jgi:lysophospholipid acyltransferase (LPLAT)-like uncharacterized protein